MVQHRKVIDLIPLPPSKKEFNLFMRDASSFNLRIQIFQSTVCINWLLPKRACTSGSPRQRTCHFIAGHSAISGVTRPYTTSEAVHPAISGEASPYPTSGAGYPAISGEARPYTTSEAGHSANSGETRPYDFER